MEYNLPFASLVEAFRDGSLKDLFQKELTVPGGIMTGSISYVNGDTCVEVKQGITDHVDQPKIYCHTKNADAFKNFEPGSKITVTGILVSADEKLGSNGIFIKLVDCRFEPSTASEILTASHG